MGRVIIEQMGYNVKTLSYKCKSKERASEIASKLPNVISWTYYGDNDRIMNRKKKPKAPELTVEEQLIKMGLIDRPIL